MSGRESLIPFRLLLAWERQKQAASEWSLGRWLRLWRWVAVYACDRLNARLGPGQCAYVVTQTGDSIRIKNCDAECWESGNCSGYCGGEG